MKCTDQNCKWNSTVPLHETAQASRVVVVGPGDGKEKNGPGGHAVCSDRAWEIQRQAYARMMKQPLSRVQLVEGVDYIRDRQEEHVISSNRVPRFRIHTEYHKDLMVFVAQTVSAFSLTRQEGYWRGVKEEGCTIEIICGLVGSPSRQVIGQLVDDIRRKFNQEEVWLTQDEVLLHRVAADAS